MKTFQLILSASKSINLHDGIFQLFHFDISVHTLNPNHNNTVTFIKLHIHILFYIEQFCQFVKFWWHICLKYRNQSKKAYGTNFSFAFTRQYFWKFPIENSKWPISNFSTILINAMKKLFYRLSSKACGATHVWADIWLSMMSLSLKVLVQVSTRLPIYIPYFLK